MTLLELLVKELSFAWPLEADGAVQDRYRQVWFYKSGKPYYTGIIWAADPKSIAFDWVHCGPLLARSDDYATAIVTREQYESAIAIQQPVWNGEGLPPVGSECEVAGQFGDGFYTCKILAHTTFGNCAVAVYQVGEDVSTGYAECFRPLRTEADRKCEEFVSLVMGWMQYAAHGEIEFIYKKISAGKIPGVELSK